MEDLSVHLIICLLVYSFISVQSCPVTVEQGEMAGVQTNVTQPNNFHTYTWSVRINNDPVTVSTCTVKNGCTDLYPELFKADWIEVTSPDYDAPYVIIFRIESVNISMSHILMDDLEPCPLEVFVRPQKPVCDEPVFSGKYFTLHCVTNRVYPKAGCDLYYTGPTKDMTVTHIQDEHIKQDDGYHTSECTFYVNVQEFKHGELYNFSATFYPDVTDGEAYEIWSATTKKIYYEQAVITEFTANTQESFLMIEENKSVTFDCEASGHPEATMKLFKGEDRQTLKRSSDPNKLTYSEVLQCDDMDKYICQADNGISTEAEVKVYVKCPLRLKDESENNREYAMDDNQNRVVVHVKGYPQPNQYTLQVLKESAMSTIPDHKYSVDSSESTSKISMQTLTLTFLDDEVMQNAQYVLSMDNGLGELQYQFSLSVTEVSQSTQSESDDFPTVAVAVGVCGGVLLIIVIAVVAYILYRRRTKAPGADVNAQTGIDNPGHSVHYNNPSAPPSEAEYMNAAPPVQPIHNVYISGFPQLHS